MQANTLDGSGDGYVPDEDCRRIKEVEVTWALLSDAASRDEASGKMNLLGIFSRISSEALPILVERACLSFRLQGSPAEYGKSKQVEICLLHDDDTTPIATMEAQLKVPVLAKGVGDIGWVLTLENIPFEAWGRYAFIILIGGEEKKRVQFDVVKVENGSQTS